MGAFFGVFLLAGLCLGIFMEVVLGCPLCCLLVKQRCKLSKKEIEKYVAWRFPRHEVHSVKFFERAPNVAICSISNSICRILLLRKNVWGSIFFLQLYENNRMRVPKIRQLNVQEEGMLEISIEGLDENFRRPITGIRFK